MLLHYFYYAICISHIHVQGSDVLEADSASKRNRGGEGAFVCMHVMVWFDRYGYMLRHLSKVNLSIDKNSVSVVESLLYSSLVQYDFTRL